MALDRLIRLAPLALLIGCSFSAGSVTEDNYAEKAAQYTCGQMKECNPISFYIDPDDWGIEGDEADLYPQGDMAACVEEYTSYFEDQMDDLEDADCSLDEDNATECMSAGSCRDIAENYTDYYDDGDGVCDEVWDCE